jgi:hypothetical protein
VLSVDNTGHRPELSPDGLSPSESAMRFCTCAIRWIARVKSAFALLLSKVTKPGIRRYQPRKKGGCMKSTISIMVGKGSINHNSRKFHAQNTDPERSNLNSTYCNIPIKQIYHELFDEAVKRYNGKQTRKDRCIDDYYEKIRSGKQEKLFHEIIVQIGNKDDMNAKTDEGHLAVKILNEYMQSFLDRNSNLKVFSAHLHMDEATPHLHIDFVPFTTGSKRGLDTRVSLKQALATQGFKGGSRQETEWSQWVQSEKEQLATVMQRHGIEWEQKGTNEVHLSVLEYKKQERAKEVAMLDYKVSDKKKELEKIDGEISNLKDKINTVENKVQFIDINMAKYENEPEWQLPKPKGIITAKNYYEKFAQPFFQKLKRLIAALFSRYYDLLKDLEDYRKQIWRMSDNIGVYKEENERLRKVEKNYNCLEIFLGRDKTLQILNEVVIRENEQVTNRRKTKFYER